MKQPKQKACKRKECENTFLQYNSLKQYCCVNCEIQDKKQKPDIKLKELRKPIATEI